jgi:hypothetical protein
VKRVLRLAIGWFLIVFGVLLALLGLAGILGSYGPGIVDPNGARIVSVVIVVIGLAICSGGVWVLRRTPKAKREPLDTAAQFKKALRREVRSTLIGTAVSAALLLLIGVGALVVSLAQDGDVNSFKSASLCRPGASNTDCYEQRAISITSVDISQGRSGENDTVHFVDDGIAHQVSLHPGNRDSSVLRAGASGTAILWHGRYTNLEVAGVAFSTDENPVGQQWEARLLAFIGIGGGLLMLAGLRYIRGGRKLGAAIAAADGFPQPQPGVESSDLSAAYPGLPLVIRPKPFSERVKPFAWLFGLVLLLVTYVALAQYGTGPQLLMVGAEVIFLVSFVAWQLLMSRNTGLFVDELNFGSTDALGRRIAHPRSEAARVVGRTVWNRQNRISTYPIVFVLLADGRPLLRIMPRLYEAGAVSQFAAALGVPYEDDPVPVTPAELNREIPTSASWIVRHSTASGAVLAVVLIGVVTAAMLLVGVPNHR